ncbi:hypothetical protein PR048_020410 [Dryococelus australis]|uniref:Uncharacterized protein n=1 Tax=Dryococelus australis TaxID=614101 RepID=A0ABQ9H6A2_9NEOP|nr:hypothetical protein PR048_020410 [Dryococelus australis]
MSFTVPKYREMTFSAETPHSVTCNMNITGLTMYTFRLRNAVQLLELPSKKAYTSVLHINNKKVDDIRKTLVYIP